ncbi:protein kinase domain-containing protein [Nocardia sp. NPDC004123]
MREHDPTATQRQSMPDLPAELRAEGFDDAQEIGRGGFGIVYRCRQRSLDRIVAVKIHTANVDPGNLERFLREQRAMGQLSGHPNIVYINQVGVTGGGYPYIAMQYYPGGSLEQRIRRTGALGWRVSLSLGAPLAGALESAHRHGIIHRDIKPANILLAECDVPKLADFGIARVTGDFETSQNVIVGSPAYMAPEVLAGAPPTPAADVYSLAATLFTAITAHAAFERREGEELVAQVLRITAQRLPDLRNQEVPDDVCVAIERAMAQEPAARTASAAEFGDELRQIQRNHGIPLDSVTVFERQPQQSVTTAHVGRGAVHNAAPPPSPATKFRPPTPPQPLIARERLLDLLHTTEQRRLIVIHAPAGFGKSSLAAQWAERLSAQAVKVSWLSIDEDDNNTSWFLAHLVESIRGIKPDLARELTGVLEEHGDGAQRYVLTTLIDQIHISGDRVVLVIDDWHRVTTASTIAALGFILENGCHHLQIVVTSRTKSGLPMSRMRVQDELTEIDSAALRFDTSESRAFLIDRGGLDLCEPDIGRLQEATDGWVAGLQLATLSLRNADNPSLLIDRISAGHHTISEFLAENVLESLDPQLLHFLLATSIPDRVNGELAVALSGEGQGQRMLEEVEEQDLFLRRIDDAGPWFRYHHLFAEFLRRRLERDEPSRVPELHLIAASWFADHGFLNEAVDHFLAGACPQGAIELVERDGLRLIEQSQMSTLLNILAKLPQDKMAASPRLQLALAWADALLQRTSEARTVLSRLQLLLDGETLAPSEKGLLQAEAQVVEAFIQLASDRPDQLGDLVAPALERSDELAPFVLSAAANAVTYAEISRFRFAEAVDTQQQASLYHSRTTGPFSVSGGYCLTGIAANERLDADAAESAFRHALVISRDSSGNQSYGARLAGALLGEVLYERGRIDEAAALLEDAHELGGIGAVIVDFLLATYGIGARIKTLRGDSSGAAALLDEGADIARIHNLPRLAAHMNSERQRCGIGETSSPASKRTSLTGTELYTITQQIQEATAIRALLAIRGSDQEEAVTRAEKLAQVIESQQRPRAYLKARLLLAAALASCDRSHDAMQILLPCVELCASTGLVRPLLDEGPQLAALARASLNTDQHDLRLSGRTRSNATFVKKLRSERPLSTPQTSYVKPDAINPRPFVWRETPEEI